MKNIAKLLICIIILTSCLSLVGCSINFQPIWFSANTEFSVTVYGVSGWDVLDFQVADSYRIAIKTMDGSEIYCDDVKFDYNPESGVISSSYDSRNNAYFYFYCYELSSGDKLSITYGGKTIEVDYNIIDFDFEAHDYVAIDSIDDLDKYSEVKEMILSIKYHEFEEPFIGFDDTWRFDRYDSAPLGNRDVYSRYCEADENDPNYISTSYLPYLTDSIYYPSKFDTVSENPVSGTEVYMYLPLDSAVGEGASRVKMEIFSLSYSVCDPCCTARYPLTSMSFSAEPIELAQTITKGNGEYPSSISILLEKYPEKFFQYKLGELTIYILCEKEEGANAYFFDETYFYHLGGYYNQKYK